MPSGSSSAIHSLMTVLPFEPVMPTTVPRELRPVMGRKPLKGIDGVVHLHEAAIPGARGGFDAPLDEERTHAPALHVGDEIMRIVVRAAHGDEHRATPQLARKRPAVGNDRPHLGIATRKLSAANGGNT